MFKQLDFRSFFNFLSRNKLYTAINILGLSLSLMFVILITDYALRQFTVDNQHEKADRIRVVGTEWACNSAYYLQKYMSDRYPEIESTCFISPAGQSMPTSHTVAVGQQKHSATVLFADTTFFRMFDFPLVRGDRDQALAARGSAMLSESFARRVFGSFDPTGQTIRLDNDADADFVVSGVFRDIEHSSIQNHDIILRADLLPEISVYFGERMGNAGAGITFLLVREGADIDAKIPDMEHYFKEIYWPYKGNQVSRVTLTPLREFYFSPLAANMNTVHGNRNFVLILFSVGAIVLAFAVMNYINLTGAQAGFRAHEMTARRLLGASRAEIVLKLILESTFMCTAAFLAAFVLAEAVAPYASQTVGAKIDPAEGLTPAAAGCYVLFVVLLGIVSGTVPSMMLSKYKPIDIVRGTFRRRTKMVYSKVLITIQNGITIALIAASLAAGQQFRYLVTRPLGYETKDIIDIAVDTFENERQIARFREELLREPCVEAVGYGCGTPHSGGNNETSAIGPNQMISFQILIGDSNFYDMFGLELIRDNHTTSPKARFFNQQALLTLGLDETADSFKLGQELSDTYEIAGIYRDFQLYSIFHSPSAAALIRIDSPEEFLEYYYPWDILVKTRGDQAEAFAAVRSVYERVVGEGLVFDAEYIEQQIENDFADQRRLLRIISIFTAIAILISALGLLAMSTYYIQQKRQEVAVRKVFGSTRREILRRLVGSFMRLVGIAFLLACPVTWYGLKRWLEEYPIRIGLSPLIFLAAGLFAAGMAFAAVYWQSNRAAQADPVDSIKN